MRIKSLLVSANHGQSYLVVGYSNDSDTLPGKWQLPAIPNEVEDFNIDRVIEHSLDVDYGLTLDKIIDRPDNSDLAYVSVIEDSLTKATIVVDDEDPTYTVEHRKFITQKELVKLLSSQDSLLADEYMG